MIFKLLLPREFGVTRSKVKVTDISVKKQLIFKVFVKARIYPYNLHTPRHMIFKLGMDIHHSKLVMPREFGVNR